MQGALTLAAALMLTAPVTGAAGGPGRQQIAVLDVRAVEGVPPGIATVLTAIVVGDVAAAGYDVISQSDVAAMLGFEKQKQLVGCREDSSCLGEIGGALGVDHVLTGQVGQIGSRYHLAFLLLDARKARVIARTARFSGRNEDQLADAAQRSVADLLRGPRAQGAAVPAGAPPRAAAAARPPQPSPPPDLSTRLPVPAPAVPPAPAPAPAAEPSRTPAWLALGAGAGLVVGGALLGQKARRDRSALASEWARPDYASHYESTMSSARDTARLANVCFAAGAISTAVSGWLFWHSRAPRVTVAPAADAGGLALVAGGSF
jgi:hypothetical protein